MLCLVDSSIAKECLIHFVFLAFNSHGSPTETCDLVEFTIKRDLPVS